MEVMLSSALVSFVFSVSVSSFLAGYNVLKYATHAPPECLWDKVFSTTTTTHTATDSVTGSIYSFPFSFEVMSVFLYSGAFSPVVSNTV